MIIGWSKPVHGGLSHLVLKGRIGFKTGCGTFSVYAHKCTQEPQGIPCKSCCKSRHLDGRWPGWGRPKEEAK